MKAVVVISNGKTGSAVIQRDDGMLLLVKPEGGCRLELMDSVAMGSVMEGNRGRMLNLTSGAMMDFTVENVVQGIAWDENAGMTATPVRNPYRSGLHH